MRTNYLRHLAIIVDILWSMPLWGGGGGQWCSRKYLGTGAVRNIGRPIVSMVLLLERAQS